MLPVGDHTPQDFQLPASTYVEKIKKYIRRFFYPVYISINHQFLSRKFKAVNFQPDLWLWGQRGNDYERHRRRVDNIFSLKGKNILVAGCGTARDIESWLKYEPESIHGIDWFSYKRAWEMWKSHISESGSNTCITFSQGDLTCLEQIPNESFDLIASDAVFEHIRDFPGALKEFYRILRPQGIIYATYGPLWFCWGGDHLSGYEALTSGYNHLLLDQSEYEVYLGQLGKFIHSEEDGRTWVEHDLFSRLKPREYLTHLEEHGFKKIFMSAIIEPSSVACLKSSKFDAKRLSGLDNIDLIVTGMTIIYRKDIS